MNGTPDHPLATRVTLAPASAADFDELLQLRITAMRQSLERVGRFNPERARERLRNSFHPEQTRFILLDGRRVGSYTFRPLDDAMQLDHLYVHPTSQSQGIGSFVLRLLIAQAEGNGLPIRLGALRHSASNHFYQRHGFVKDREEEWDVYYARAAPRKGR